jgi:hypothetical protein
MKLCIVTFLGVLLATTAGCAAETPEIAEGDGETTTQDLAAAPQGAKIASVIANGSGCPAGTWEAELAPDGVSLAVHFRAYSASVTPGQSVAVASCIVAIDLIPPAGYEYAVNSFVYTGFVDLDSAGMRATQTAKYYFSGNPLPAKELRTDMNGPYDSAYVFTDRVDARDLVWSSCAVSRRLQSQSRLIVQNNARHDGTGGALINSELVFRYGLSWRRC